MASAAEEEVWALPALGLHLSPPQHLAVHSLALALILAASGGRAQAVQRKAVGCKAVGCKAMGCKPWGCNTGEVVVVRWCGEVVERWEHVHVHTHTPHTHRRMS